MIYDKDRTDKMRTPVITLAVILCVVLLASAAVGGPNLAIPESSFDFGYVPQHAKISHVFWLYSTGDSTLNITKVLPG